jgi:hypothetical protein
MLHIVIQIAKKSEENLTDFAVSIRYCTRSLEVAQRKLEELQRDEKVQNIALQNIILQSMDLFHVPEEKRTDVESKSEEFIRYLSNKYTPEVRESEYKIISVGEDQDIDKIIGRLYADNRW